MKQMLSLEKVLSSSPNIHVPCVSLVCYRSSQLKKSSKRQKKKSDIILFIWEKKRSTNPPIIPNMDKSSPVTKQDNKLNWYGENRSQPNKWLKSLLQQPKASLLQYKSIVKWQKRHIHSESLKEKIQHNKLLKEFLKIIRQKKN